VGNFATPFFIQQNKKRESHFKKEILTQCWDLFKIKTQSRLLNTECSIHFAGIKKPKLGKQIWAL
jgi:hypothetical protein